ncbi:MAG: ABC-type sugar transport system, periplasmic component [Desulfotomaculum sp. 46_296]|nr:MAG: ABC-type sugar transport system, periplasmic component [Desulfotomaculum sp. 46_296]HAU31650.1 sugar ABC transporter substrate-binding protein [Desulfotomaculum sp.]
MLIALKRIFPLIIAVCLVIVNGCGQQAERKPISESLNLAVSFSDLRLDGNKIIQQEMMKRSKKEDTKIEFLDAKNDAQEQIKQLDQLLQKGTKQLKALIVQPVDPTSVNPVIERFKRANIKVLALETLPRNVPVDGYITSDHILAGRLEAIYLLKALNGGYTNQVFPGVERRQFLNTFILRGDQRDQISNEIVAGIRDELNKEPRVKIIEEIVCLKNEPGLGAMTADQFLNKYNNSGIDAILATDSRLVMEYVKALQFRGSSHYVITVGVGADEESSRALIEGEHNAEIDTMPELVGQYAYDAAVSLSKTGSLQYDNRILNGDYGVPARIVPVQLIQKNNSYLLEQRWSKEQKQGGRQESKEQGSESQENSGDSGSSQSQGQGGSGSKQNNAKTKLKITTQEGKKVEVEIPGEIKNIESVQEGQAGKGSSEGSEGAGGE